MFGLFSLILFDERFLSPALRMFWLPNPAEWQQPKQRRALVTDKVLDSLIKTNFFRQDDYRNGRAHTTNVGTQDG